MSLIVGIGVGYVITPEYKMDDVSAEMGLGKADKYLDLRYIDAMIAHHKSAMVLAERVKYETHRQEIKDIASMILTNEPKLIDELYGWKKEWYGNTKEVKAAEVPILSKYDEKLDLRFLNALIVHHENGLEMAMEVKTKSSKNEILNNADVLIDFFTKSGEELEGLRNEFYGV